MAHRFGVTYAAAAMALLRLTRQGLYLAAEDGLYCYKLSEQGHARLEFFRNQI